jgi:16S rRNA (cytosine967-C5)-methyltransferase
VRRHPDIKWLRRPEDVAGFARTQAEILDALWQTLAPGGTMLYATCSLFPEENVGQVAAFVARHPDAQRLPTHGDELDWQLMPDAEQDGFYYARLAKR